MALLPYHVSTMLSILFYTLFTSLVCSNVDAARKARHFSKPPNLLISTLETIRQSSSDDRGRLTFEKCDAILECESPRFCERVSERGSFCTGAGACHCLPIDIAQCTSHIHCVEGEVCADVEDFGTVCAAESFVNEFAGAQKLPGQKPPPPPFPSGKGLTFDPCERTTTCDSPRFCMTIVDEGEFCSGALACHCVPVELISCSSSRECVDGEICTSLPDRGNICVSESYANHRSTTSQDSPTTDPPASSESPGGASRPESSGNTGETGTLSPEPICVAAKSLQHLPRHALRFKMDIDAHVLCDPNDSCATPGHMIVYHGEPMMMVSYCKLTPCERRIMKVNSPRYQRGMKISSRTSGLTFTAFAARYGTFTEEVVLKTVLRLGM